MASSIHWLLIVLAFQSSLICASCPKGRFGPICEGWCHCLGGENVCDAEDGKCSDGMCSHGWTNPPTCQQACPADMFGANCSFTCRCRSEDTCNQINGLCSSHRCRVGWTGASCQTKMRVLDEAPNITILSSSQLNVRWAPWVDKHKNESTDSEIVAYKLQVLENVLNADWSDERRINVSSYDLSYSHTLIRNGARRGYKFRVLVVEQDVTGKESVSLPGPDTPWYIVGSGDIVAKRKSNETLLDERASDHSNGVPVLDSHKDIKHPPINFEMHPESNETCPPKPTPEIVVKLADYVSMTVARLLFSRGGVARHKKDQANVVQQIRLSRPVLQVNINPTGYLIVVDTKLGTFLKHANSTTYAMDVCGDNKDILLPYDDAAAVNRTYYVAGWVDPSTTFYDVGNNLTSGPTMSVQYMNIALTPDTVYKIWVIAENRINKNASRVIVDGAIDVRTCGAQTALKVKDLATLNIILSQTVLFIVACGFFVLLVLIIFIISYMCCISNSFCCPVVKSCIKPVYSKSSYLPRCSVTRQLETVFSKSYARCCINRSGCVTSRGCGDAPDYMSGYPPVYDDRRVVANCRSNPIAVQRLREFCNINVRPRLTVELDSKMQQPLPPIYATEFAKLPSCFTDRTLVGSNSAHAVLNQSQRVVPYDQNRVRVGRDKTYINASYIRTVGFQLCIVTQCPLVNTNATFWHMVFEQRASTIVILLGPSISSEGIDGDAKSPGWHSGYYKYWPETVGKPLVFDRLNVELISESVYAYYTVRKIQLCQLPKKGYTDQPFTLLQWQYTSWLHDGVPVHPVLFLSFVKCIHDVTDVRRCVVHCRTGGGRSGVYVAINTLLAQGHDGFEVDVLKCVAFLRTQRAEMVRTFAQYQFIYECLAEEFDHPVTRFHGEQFIATFDHAIECPTQCTEYGLISLPFYTVGNMPCDLSSDMPITVLDLFTVKEKLVVSQCQFKMLTEQFWARVISTTSTVVVMFNKVGEMSNEDYYSLPRCGRYLHCGKRYTIKCERANVKPAFNSYNLVIIIHSDRGSSGDKESGTSSEQEYRLVFYEVTCWTVGVTTPCIRSMLDVLSELRSSDSYNGRLMLLNMSSEKYGSRAELLTVLWWAVEQAEIEDIVDIFSVVRYVRTYLPTAVTDHEQYIFLYRSVWEHVKKRQLENKKLKNTATNTWPTNQPIPFPPQSNSKPIGSIVAKARQKQPEKCSASCTASYGIGTVRRPTTVYGPGAVECSGEVSNYHEGRERPVEICHEHDCVIANPSHHDGTGMSMYHGCPDDEESMCVVGRPQAAAHNFSANESNNRDVNAEGEKFVKSDLLHNTKSDGLMDEASNTGQAANDRRKRVQQAFQRTAKDQGLAGSPLFKQLSSDQSATILKTVTNKGVIERLASAEWDNKKLASFSSRGAGEKYSANNSGKANGSSVKMEICKRGKDAERSSDDPGKTQKRTDNGNANAHGSPIGRSNTGSRPIRKGMQEMSGSPFGKDRMDSSQKIERTSAQRQEPVNRPARSGSRKHWTMHDIGGTSEADENRDATCSTSGRKVTKHFASFDCRLQAADRFSKPSRCDSKAGDSDRNSSKEVGKLYSVSNGNVYRLESAADCEVSYDGGLTSQHETYVIESDRIRSDTDLTTSRSSLTLVTEDTASVR